MKECFVCLGSVVKNGLSKTKKQQFYCKPCKKSYTDGGENKEKIKKDAFKEATKMQSLRQIAKEYSVSPSTILNWLNRMNNLKSYIEIEKSIKLSEIQSYLQSNNINSKKGIFIIEENALMIDLTS
jgi:transposase-like protein